MVSLTHQKVSTAPDSGDPSLVQGSDWNAEHALTCSTGVVLGRSSAGTGAVEEVAFTSLPVSTATQTALNAKVNASSLGAASGVATLGSDSKLTASQIPDISIVTYLGAVASQAAMLALTGQQGDWCTRSDLGTNWIITGSTPSSLSSWTQLSYPTAPVTSVNSKTGAVTLSASDVGAQASITVNGIVKGNGAGTLSAAVSGTDFAPATSGSAILKGNAAGGFSLAVAKTDYAPATSGTSILKGDGLGGFSAATGGTDYQTAQSVTGLVKSSGTTRSAAVSGTDYAPATSGTEILYGNGLGGFSNVTVGSGLSFTAGTLAATGGGSMTYPGAGVAVSTGTAWGTSLTAPSGTIVGTTDTQSLSNKTLTGTQETVYAITDGAAFEINPANGGIQTITLGASRTPKGTSFAAGQSVTLMVTAGANTLTWTDTTFGTSGVKWVGASAPGSAPTLSTSALSIIELWKIGSQVYGAFVGVA